MEHRTCLANTVGSSKNDHDSLAFLLERVAAVCRDPAQQHGDCTSCTQERHRCAEALVEIATELAAIILAHIHRENAAMEKLPPLPAVNMHCSQHRRVHVEFSTRYNGIVSGLDPRNVAADAHKLEGLLCDWVREHALEYDAVFTDLLQASRVR